VFSGFLQAFSESVYRACISLYDDKPKIVWDFHSLILTIQSIFGFALTDEERPLRICKSCSKAFIAGNPDDEFCNLSCNSQYDDQNSK